MSRDRRRPARPIPSVSRSATPTGVAPSRVAVSRRRVPRRCSGFRPIGRRGSVLEQCKDGLERTVNDRAGAPLHAHLPGLDRLRDQPIRPQTAGRAFPPCETGRRRTRSIRRQTATLIGVRLHSPESADPRSRANIPPHLSRRFMPRPGGRFRLVFRATKHNI